MASPTKIILAYSGGLDTSIILKWLQTEYNCDVVTFTADLGQGEELEPARAKAEKMGASSIYVEDLREEYLAAREKNARKRGQKTFSSLETIRANTASLNWDGYQPITPSFIGNKTINN